MMMFKPQVYANQVQAVVCLKMCPYRLISHGMQVSVLSDLGTYRAVLGMQRWAVDGGGTVCIYRCASLQAGDMVSWVTD